MKIKMKFAALLALLVVVTTFPVFGAAPRAGDRLGDVLNTDIRVFINGTQIMGYNIDGWTFVVAEDLRPYGFGVLWNPANLSLSISQGQATESFKNVPVNTYQAGTVAFPYVYTDIVTYIDNMPVKSYNIQGYTVIQIDDLANRYGQLEWNQYTKEVRVTTTSNISGRIYGGDFSTGISGAVVFLKNANGIVVNSVSAQANGSYTFSNVSPGSYRIEASAPGYTLKSTDVFTVSGTVSDKNLSLTKSTFSVSGRVVGSDAANGIAATLRLINSSGSTADTRTASSNGTYSFTVITPGSYTIEASMTGYATQTSSAFTLSETLVNRDFTLQKNNYSISGRITDYNTNNAVAAELKLINSSGQTIDSKYADSNGYYTFTGVGSGNYTVSVAMNGYTTSTMSQFSVSGNVSNKDYKLQRAGLVVKGTIYNGSNYNYYNNEFTVRLVDNRSKNVVYTQNVTIQPYQYGDYSFSGVTAQVPYYISIMSNNSSVYEGSAFNVYSNDYSVQPINLSGNNSGGYGSYSINGYVFANASNAPASYANIELRDFNNNSSYVASTQTASNGSFTFSGISSGRYYFIVTYNNTTTHYPSSGSGSTYGYIDINGSTAGNSNVYNMPNIYLQNTSSTSSLTVTVYGGGNRLTNANVQLRNNVSGAYVSGPNYNNNTYVFNSLSAGDYTLDATAPNYRWSGYITVTINAGVNATRDVTLTAN